MFLNLDRNFFFLFGRLVHFLHDREDGGLDIRGIGLGFVDFLEEGLVCLVGLNLIEFLAVLAHGIFLLLKLAFFLFFGELELIGFSLGFTQLGLFGLHGL